MNHDIIVADLEKNDYNRSIWALFWMEVCSFLFEKDLFESFLLHKKYIDCQAIQIAHSFVYLTD